MIAPNRSSCKSTREASAADRLQLRSHGTQFCMLDPDPIAINKKGRKKNKNTQAKGLIHKSISCVAVLGPSCSGFQSR
jgi:hypothetical protein